VPLKSIQPDIKIQIFTSSIISTVCRLRHFLEVASYCILQKPVSRSLIYLDDNGALLVVPQIQKTCSLAVLVAGMDNSFLARSANFRICELSQLLLVLTPELGNMQ